MINDTKKKTKIQVKTIKPRCWEYSPAKITYEGDKYVTVVQQEKKVLTHVKKLSKTHYQVISTGEVKEYQPMTQDEKRVVRRASLARTFRNLSGLIRTNFVGKGEQGWEQQVLITLTYAENMQDEKRLYEDFKVFIKMLSRKYKDKYRLEYIAVAEPQGRGAWHVHLMLKTTNDKKLWVSHGVLTKLWKHGNSSIERLKAEDMGSYYVAYFTNLIPGTANIADDDLIETGQEIYEAELQKLAKMQKGQGADIKSIKGARIEFYPPHFKFFRTSRGVNRPNTETDYLYEITQDKRYKAVYERSYEISKTEKTEGMDAEEIAFLNRIYRGTYRLKDKL